MAANPELNPIDQEITNSINLQVLGAVGGGGTSIPIQYPPKFFADSKQSNWDGKDQGAYEPIRTYKGSEARSLQLKLYYVVTGGIWTPTRIASIGRDIRSYYYNTVRFGLKEYPIVRLNAYEIVPQSGGQQMTLIMMNTSASYSEELVRFGGKTFPLRTEYTLDLESATRIGPISAVAGQLGSFGQAAIKIQSNILAPSPQPEWF